MKIFEEYTQSKKGANLQKHLDVILPNKLNGSLNQKFISKCKETYGW